MQKGSKDGNHPPNSAANLDASIFTESERKALIAAENGSFFPPNFTPQPRRVQSAHLVGQENPYQLGSRQQQPRPDNLTNLRVAQMEIPLPSPTAQAEFPQIPPPTPSSNGSNYSYMINNNMNSFAQALQDMDKPFHPDDIGLSQEDKIRLFEAPSTATGDGSLHDCYLPTSCNLALNGMMNDSLQPFPSNCRPDTSQSYEMLAQGTVLPSPQPGMMNDPSVPYGMDQYYFYPPQSAMPQDPLQRHLYMNQQQRF